MKRKCLKTLKKLVKYINCNIGLNVCFVKINFSYIICNSFIIDTPLIKSIYVYKIDTTVIKYNIKQFSSLNITFMYHKILLYKILGFEMYFIVVLQFFIYLCRICKKNIDINIIMILIIQDVIFSTNSKNFLNSKELSLSLDYSMN